MIYFDELNEAIYTVRFINPNTEVDTKGKVKYYTFRSEIDIEYKDNPKIPKSNQTQKETSIQVFKKYDAKIDSKDSARGYFKQELIRRCGANVKNISDNEATQIRDAWRS